MQQIPRVRTIVSLASVLALAFTPLTPHTKAAPQRTENGQGDIHRDDPCAHLPSPEGLAKGIAKMCPAGGSSKGVAKGDFNNDGFADLAIGEPDATVTGVSGAGDVVILYGSQNGLTTSGNQIWSLASTNVPSSPETGDGLGTALASGDFNGDGYTDLAIGIPYKPIHGNVLGVATTTNGAGAILILYGSANGLTTTNSSVPPPRFLNLNSANLPSAPATCAWTFGQANLGFSLAWGDFNNDGAGDLAAAAPGLNIGATVIPCASPALATGGVWQLFGSFGGANGGISLTSNRLWVENDIPGNSSQAADYFGNALSGGDFNGDGYADMAVGAPGKTVLSAGAAGQVSILLGGPIGLNPAAGAQNWNMNSIVTSGAAKVDDNFGFALAAADFNGDGKADLAIGVPGGHTGSTTVDSGFVIEMFGSQSVGLVKTGNQLFDSKTFAQSQVDHDRFGSAFAANDFDNDGKADLAIGVPLKDFSLVRNGSTVNLTDAGQVDVMYGSASGLSTSSTQVWTQESVGGPGAAHNGNQFGFSLSAWNFGHNQFFTLNGHTTTLKTADLAIGVPYQSVGGKSGAGAIYVLYGSNLAGLSITNAQVFTMDSIGFGGLAGAHFGLALY